MHKNLSRHSDGGANGSAGGNGQPLDTAIQTPKVGGLPAGDTNDKQPTQPIPELTPDNPIAYWKAQAEKFERLHKNASDEVTTSKKLLEQMQDETVKVLTDKFVALQTELDMERKRAGEATIEALRANMVAEFKLGIEAVGFLTGNDEAALRKQAETLAKLTGKPPPPPPTGNVGNPATTGGLTLADIAKMSTNEAAKNLEAIKAVLAGGK